MKNQNESKRKGAEEILRSFLQKYRVSVGVIREDSISIDQLIPSTLHHLQLTRFRVLDDTYLYTRLLDTLLKIVPPSSVTKLIDLGAGSSIPTIGAISKSKNHSELQIVAVDNDSEAVEISKRNADECGLISRFTFIQEDMLKFLLQNELQPDHVLVSNPPYAPVPTHLTDPFYHPADGGVDGTKYVEPILSKQMPLGTIVAIRWCSLGNPVRIITLIEHNFDVLHIEAHLSPLGTYTGSEPLRNHLESLRDSGISVFTTTPDGNRELISVGCILKKH